MSSVEPSAMGADQAEEGNRIVRELDVYVANGMLPAGSQVGVPQESWGVRAPPPLLARPPAQHPAALPTSANLLPATPLRCADVPAPVPTAPAVAALS